MMTHEAWTVSARCRLQKQQFITRLMVMVMMMMMMSTNCQAQTICPRSSNCSVVGDLPYSIDRMNCFDFGVQEVLPDACQYLLIVPELTLEPDTSEIRTLQSRAFEGLRVRKLVLSGLGIEAVNETAFESLASYLTELYLDHNRLTTMPDGVFSSLSSLTHLQLQNNRLTTVGRHLLDGLASLLVLDLSGNHIGDVDLEAWTPVPLLSTLRLHDNVVDGTLNSTRLAGLGQLENLRLDGNRISELAPDAFRPLPNLRRLSVARNRIPALPGSVFAANAQLTDVDASQNEIAGLESDVFNETRRLERLLLHDNRISTLPIYVFRHMNNLRKLHLQRNSVSGILSNSLSGLSSLRQLDLSHNRVRWLPHGIFDPLGLVETLSFADNQIAVVERRPFASTRNLVTLDLSDNRLDSIDADWFQTASRLTTLHLEGNRLSAIHPEALSSVPTLRELHLNRNLLSSVDDGFFLNCSSLDLLDLSSNPLRRIRDAGSTFAGLTSLRRLNLSATCITELSLESHSVAPVLPALKELDISSNTLQNLSASTFAGLPGLRRLHLSANDIDVLDNSTFSMLSRLELLDLSGNALMSDDQLSTALSVLPPSAVVDLSWNLLTSVDELPPLPAGVYLVGNPLRCDCNTSSWLAADVTRLLDSERTACLDRQTGLAAALACYWVTCFANTTTSRAGALAADVGCTAPDDALSYLTTPLRRPAVFCPWDAVPPAVRSITVDVTSATSIHVSWNLTSAADVTITVDVGREPKNASDERYEFPANVSDSAIGNLTSGETYVVCATTTSGGDRACAVVVLSVERPSTEPPAALELSVSATSTATALHVAWVAATTSGHVQLVRFRLRWTQNGTSNDVSATSLDRSSTSYTISGLRPSTVYLVCIDARQTTGNTTRCDYFSTRAANNDTMLIVIVASAAGAFLLLLLLIIVIVCCCCCRRRRHDDASTKPDATVRAVESTRSVRRGTLAEHSVVSVSVYENLP